MLGILNSLNAHSFPIFHPILIILVSKFMVHRALSDKTHLSLGLLSPYFVSNVRQIFAADDFSRRHFQMHYFLGALRVNQ